jgi:Membrane-bound serine protease (ClpP class)
VTENLDLTAEKALELNVIEFVAEDMNELLSKIDGFESVKGTLYTENVVIVEYNAPFTTDILDVLGDPYLAALLITIGIPLLIFGLVSPGYGAEIVGVLSITLGLIGMGFNVSYLALFMLILGAVLLIFELVTPAFGILGVSGIIIMALGGMFIIPLNTEWYISGETMNSLVLTVIAVSVFLTLFLVFAIYKVLQARKRKPVFAMEGGKAKASEDLDPEGLVVYDGEYWKAKSNSGKIEKGEDVIIVGKDRSELIVKKLKS